MTTEVDDISSRGRLYLAVEGPVEGPKYRADARRGAGTALPEGWTLVDEPDGATAILAVDVAVTAEMVKSAGSSLRLIGTVGPSVDADAAAAAEVPVVELPSVHDLSQPVVAEYTVAMILALTRNLLAIARETAAARWAPGRDTPALTDQRNYTYNWVGLEGAGFLYGKAVGIVGIGSIGSVVARLLAPFKVRLLYTQRHRLDEREERRLGVEWRPFDDFLRECDVITLHHRFQEGPDGNEHQFGAREFSLMKPTAFLVNTARGRVIDEDALVAALRERRIGGVALDVFRYEPLPPEHPLLSLAGDNVILSSHIAFGSESAYWDHVLRGLLSSLGAASSSAEGAA